MLLVSNELSDGKRLASKLKSQFYSVPEKAYPDGEKILFAKNSLGKANIIYFKFGTKHGFDGQLFKLMCLLERFATEKTTNLVLPYLPYLRSYPLPSNEIDMLAYILGQIRRQVKNIYLISPHVSVTEIKKHLKIKNVFTIDIDNQIVKQIKSFGKNLILVSPDKGFSESIKRLALKIGVEYIVLSKKRFSPTKVMIKSEQKTRRKIILSKNKTFIIVDDIISTGSTLFEAAGHLKYYGVKKIKFIVVHNTCKKLDSKKINVFCSNSLIYPDNQAKQFDIVEGIFDVFGR